VSSSLVSSRGMRSFVAMTPSPATRADCAPRWNDPASMTDRDQARDVRARAQRARKPGGRPGSWPPAVALIVRRQLSWEERDSCPSRTTTCADRFLAVSWIPTPALPSPYVSVRPCSVACAPSRLKAPAPAPAPAPSTAPSRAPSGAIGSSVNTSVRRPRACSTMPRN